MVGAEEKELVVSSWPPLQGRGGGSSSSGAAANEGAARMAPFSSPDHYWRRSYEATREFETLSLRINPPRVVIDNTTDPEATLVKVDSANRHGCLLEVVQVLTDLDLVISKAYISSDGGWFVDVFHVKDSLGRKVVDQGQIEYMQQALGAKREASVQEVRTSLGRSVMLWAPAEHTAIELSGMDRPGLLSEISAVLTSLGCNVVDAEVWTHNLRAAGVVYITEQGSGGPIKDADLMERIKRGLKEVMKVGEKSSAHAGLAGGGATHTERRLHQMMFADKDYESSSPSGPRLGPKERANISVRNCAETLYSIVDVKCVDRPKLLFDTVCTLTDMKYVVFHATIDSHEGIATQEYYIRHMDGGVLESEAERAQVIRCLEAAIERRTPEGMRLELRTRDRAGLLSDVTRVFSEKGISVTRADVATEGDIAVNTFYVLDASGKPVDPSIVDAMRKEIGTQVLQVKEPAPPLPLTAPKSVDKPNNSLVNMIRSHSERWLFSLGLGASPPGGSALSFNNHSNSLASSTRW